MVAATLMSGSQMERDAEQYLAGTLGVTRLLPHLWEAVLFERQTLGQRWTRRDLARRYLDLLRDHTHRSRLDLS